MIRQAQLGEIRTLLRFASGPLTDNERAALSDWLAGISLIETARELHITRGGVWMIQRSAMRKMRVRLESLGVRSVQQVLDQEA